MLVAERSRDKQFISAGFKTRT
ncbi:MAG: hypothetical protein JWQ29_2570, partial [Phenylobacterium sp.]|nr:hypothetical protein [Phenylobacterium sp.]